jgi:MIP family channel proteins
MNTRALVAEFIGTFTLIFIGAGAGALGVGGLVGVALAHGLVIMTFAYAYGHISGGHFNPAVTIGLWVGKQIKTADAIAYIVVQLLGGIAGAFVLVFALGSTPITNGVTLLATPSATSSLSVSPLQGVVIEAILTFLLVNSIFNTAVNGKAGNLAPLAIGMTLTLAILMGGPLTGGSLNPARTIGPMLAAGNFTNFWVYLVGEIVGAVLAALLYIGLLKPKE